jgi:hypothetical protein
MTLKCLTKALGSLAIQYMALCQPHKHLQEPLIDSECQILFVPDLPNQNLLFNWVQGDWKAIKSMKDIVLDSS